MDRFIIALRVIHIIHTRARAHTSAVYGCIDICVGTTRRVYWPKGLSSGYFAPSEQLKRRYNKTSFTHTRAHARFQRAKRLISNLIIGW